MRANTTVWFFDVSTNQNSENGNRNKVIVSKSKIGCEKSQVGMQTYWAAFSASITLSYTLQLPETSYKLQKYCYFKDKNIGRLFEVYNTSKGEAPHLIKANVKEIDDSSLKELIENAII